MPGEDSFMHEKNRGYSQKDLQDSWKKFTNGFFLNQFKIRDFNMYREGYKGDSLFEDLKRKTDVVTKEGVQRSELTNSDVIKMVPPGRVVVMLMFLLGLRKMLERRQRRKYLI